MSGIVAMVQASGHSIDPLLLARTLSLLEQRGPDDQAYWLHGQVALGHTALKTTYESQSESQPSTLDRKCWLTADARIDDRAALIAKLQAHGQGVLGTASDDHLILHAYEVWGTDCVKHLIGDFAFALWDEGNHLLFCATDQFGVAPLFFAKPDDGSPEAGLMVSNSLNCIRLHPNVTDTLCEQAIGDYLLFRVNTDPGSTTFEDIHKLPAGHQMIWKNGRLRVSRYWAPGEPEYRRRGAHEYEREFAGLFETAVSDRLRADSAGTHVSGGMDSTSIAAVLAEAKKTDGSRADIRAYTQVPSDDSLRVEKPFAQLAADKLGIPVRFHEGREAGPLFEDNFEGATALPPEPSFVTANTARQRTLEDVQTFGNVLFAGFGGDPLLDPAVHYRGHTGNALATLADAKQHWQIHRSYPTHLLPFLARLRRSGTRRTAGPVIPDWIVKEFGTRSHLHERQEQHLHHSSAASNRRQSMANHGLWRRVFDWHDPGFTGVPVKVRFPFFDVRLVTWALSVPPVPWFYKKHLLRQIMQDRLPPEIVERPKTALPGNLFRSALQGTHSIAALETALQEPRLEPYVHARTFLDRAQTSGALTSSDAKAIMRVASLSLWLGEYNQFKARSMDHYDKQLTSFTRRL